MRQTMKPAQDAAQCDGLASGLRCGDMGRFGPILHPTAQRSDPPVASPSHFPAMNAHADFAATLASIRSELWDWAMDADKPQRTAMMRAAAALALFESDMLRKAAGPVLPGESPSSL
jgi:hypothetical protein